MDTMDPAATFTATRAELLGDSPLLGAAEIARGVTRHADRAVSVFAMTRDRMRRIDGWLGSVGFVTHAAAPGADQPVIGSVCDRDRANDLLADIVVAFVGALPAVAAPTGLDLPSLDVLSPGTLPSGVGWVAVITASYMSTLSVAPCVHTSLYVFSPPESSTNPRVAPRVTRRSASTFDPLNG